MVKGGDKMRNLKYLLVTWAVIFYLSLVAGQFVVGHEYPLGAGAILATIVTGIWLFSSGKSSGDHS